MAHITQEKKKEIAVLIKPLLKEYGIKGTLSISNHSTIYLNLKSGKLDLMGNCSGSSGRDYIQVNPWSFDRDFSGACLEFLTKAHNALRSADWYDNTDVMTDYFDTAYYYYVHIGEYNKPYIFNN